MSAQQQQPAATEDKTVPSEQITKEAKEAEPDAVEENDKREEKGMDNLPTIT